MRRRPSRRTVLLGGLGAAVATGAGVVTGVLPGGPSLRRALGWTGPDGVVPDVPAAPVEIDRVRSAARGRDVDLVLVRPGGASATLPVCLALHGRGVGARSFLDLGLPRFLTAALRSGVPPFAVVAVDAGDSYYVAREPADDPRRMLAEELPGWLAERGLPPPAGLLGISMGAFGALRHTAGLADVPLGVWCGTEDPFIDSARELIDRTRPEIATISAGAHDDGYFRRVMPDMLRFVGPRIDQSVNSIGRWRG